MSRQENKRVSYYGGLLVILIVYTLYNLAFRQVWFYETVPWFLRHAVKFAVILLVYFVGRWVFRRYPVAWLLSVWNLLYAVCTVIVLLLGVYDGVIGMGPSIRFLGDAVYEFLISPVAFVALKLVERRMR
ncbi:MAG TPA: hypothetical protein VGM30_01135 [Puia sp.]|jgi:hypothetical protein